jgi:probable type I restriction-modification system
MRKYSEYKDSGVKWIGDIPKHWEVLRAKNMFVRMSREVRNEDDVITCFRDGEVTLRKNRRIEGFTESFKEIGYQGIRKGDLVIHQMDAFAGSIGVSDSDGKGTPVYICLQPKGNYSNNYYAYLLREMARAGFIKSLYRGIRERSSDFRYETFAKLFLPIPPLTEQRAIVSYLDSKVGQIDTYVAKQTQQIELLKELKQAVIANAVTKGIDKKTKLKQTGISWIGSVPQHWERCRCKDVLTETKLLVGNGKHTLLSLTTNGVIVRDLSEGKGKFPKDFNTYKVVKPNDLVFCLFDVDETPRTVGLVHNHGMLTGAYNVFETKNVDTSFLYHYFIALDNRKALKPLYKGLRKVIPLPAFMSMPLYLPPLSEQRAIVSYIEAKTASINKLIDAYQQQVERIKEYKQRLISDAVTGKMNVTDEQTQTN